MANVRLGDDRKENVTVKLPAWVKRQIKEQGGPQKVLLPLILPHFKKEESIDEKSN